MKNKPWKPEMAGAWVTWSRIGFGQMVYVCYVPNFTHPVGLVWGHPQGERFCVAGSFTNLAARRCGVRSKINDVIFTHYACISTVTGSKDGGRSFLKGAGYRHSKAMRCFYLERPSKRKR